MSEAVDDLSQYSSIRGLEDESLSALIDILTTPGKLDQGSTAAIINSLYPRNKVPEGIAVKVVGCFGQGQSKPSLQVQVLMAQRSCVTQYSQSCLGSFTAMAGNDIQCPPRIHHALSALWNTIQFAGYDYTEVSMSLKSRAIS